jgi:hypothetical protein
MTPVYVAQFFTQSTGKLLRPLDEATRRGYRDALVDFVQAHPVKYLGLGIEVNVLWEKSPADFEAFMGLSHEVYAAVKRASPDMQVFTVLQLEKMKGLNGGLFGGVNDTTSGEWALPERFSEADVVAFTTYPGLIFRSPADIPAGYYAEIAAHAKKPVMLTEVGWQAGADVRGWESSDEEQAAFVRLFVGMI